MEGKVESTLQEQGWVLEPSNTLQSAESVTSTQERPVWTDKAVQEDRPFNAEHHVNGGNDKDNDHDNNSNNSNSSSTSSFQQASVSHDKRDRSRSPQGSRAASDSRSPSSVRRHRNASRSRSPRSRSPEARHAEMKEESACLFIGNIPYHFQERDVRALFEPFGTVADVTVPFDSRLNHNKGISFVRFETRAMAEEAKRAMENERVEGRNIRLDWDIGSQNKTRYGSSRVSDGDRRYGGGGGGSLYRGPPRDYDRPREGGYYSRGGAYERREDPYRSSSRYDHRDFPYYDRPPRRFNDDRGGQGYYGGPSGHDPRYDVLKRRPYEPYEHHPQQHDYPPSSSSRSDYRGGSSRDYVDRSSSSSYARDYEDDRAERRSREHLSRDEPAY